MSTRMAAARRRKAGQPCRRCGDPVRSQRTKSPRPYPICGQCKSEENREYSLALHAAGKARKRPTHRRRKPKGGTR